jgi:hypothetical protein
VITPVWTAVARRGIRISWGDGPKIRVGFGVDVYCRAKTLGFNDLGTKAIARDIF